MAATRQAFIRRLRLWRWWPDLLVARPAAHAGDDMVPGVCLRLLFERAQPKKTGSRIGLSGVLTDTAWGIASCVIQNNNLARSADDVPNN